MVTLNPGRRVSTRHDTESFHMAIGHASTREIWCFASMYPQVRVA